MKKLIVANWKMNPQSKKEAESLFMGVAKLVKSIKKSDVVICPPSIFLSDLKKKNVKKILLGAQDIFYENSGPYTGEISPPMLYSSGVKYVIVGHSMCRILGDTDIVVSKKVAAVLKIGMTPILCIGESDRDDSTSYLSFVKRQLIDSLNGVSKTAFKKIIVAYEPIWSISTSATREATPEESREMALFIRKVFSDISNTQTAHSVRILYGGSVNSKNIDEFLAQGGVNGFLVGGASLSVKDFSKIIIKTESK